MAVISPPILKILSDLDIDLMDVDSDMDYLRALMEATNSLTISNPSDRRIPILQKEVKRVRDNRRAKSQIVKKKVSTSKLLNRKDVGEKGKESNTGKLSRILRDTRGRVLSNEKRLDNLRPEENQQEGSDNQSFNPIIDGLNSIIETLKSERKFDKKKEEKQRKEKEKKRRAVKEKIIEGGKGVWKGVQKAGAVILGPFQKVWNDLLGFIGKIILGRVLFKLLDWLGDKKNQKKMKSIFKFIGDYWPVLLAGYLLFGNALTSFISGLLLKMVMWVPKMLFAIGKLMLNPWIAAAVGLGLTAAWLSTKKNKTDQNVDQSVEDVGKEETVNRLKEEKEDKNVLEKMGGVITGEGQERDEQIQRVETGEERSYGRGGFTGEMIKGSLGPLGRILFNKGGTVPGSGNKDTVPAMLTPGEFVMSKGAVQKYGVNALEGMNAAAGGTNRPTLGRYKTGGKVQNRGVVTDPEKKKRIEEETLYWVNKERVERLGLPPLDKISYADGVELTKPMGKEFYGAGIKETSETDMNFDTMTKTTWKTKSRGAEIIFQGATETITEEEKQAYLDSNPLARMAMELKDQAEMDALGADISASAKMKGGGLVQGLRGGGLVLNLGQTPMAQMSELREERKEIYRRQVNGKMSKEDRKKLRKVNAQINELGNKIKAESKKSIKKNNLQVSNEQKKIATPGSITKKPKVTVAYQNELNNSGSSNTPAGGNKKIPTFSAVKMRSGDKIRVLGISV